MSEYVPTRILWVNKKSGTAHARRDCTAIALVPSGALREVQIALDAPRVHFRCCGYCWRLTPGPAPPT